MEKETGLNIVVREEEQDGKKIFIMNNEELGIADFGYTLDHPRLTDIYRKIPQLGIFPNCSLQSQLPLSPMLNLIKSLLF